jgi:hypothetical protein
MFAGKISGACKIEDYLCHPNTMKGACPHTNQLVRASEWQSDSSYANPRALREVKGVNLIGSGIKQQYKKLVHFYVHVNILSKSTGLKRKS